MTCCHLWQRLARAFATTGALRCKSLPASVLHRRAFGVVKRPVLQRQTAHIAMPNGPFRNSACRRCPNGVDAVDLQAGHSLWHPGICEAAPVAGQYACGRPFALMARGCVGATAIRRGKGLMGLGGHGHGRQWLACQRDVAARAACNCNVGFAVPNFYFV